MICTPTLIHYDDDVLIDRLAWVSVGQSCVVALRAYRGFPLAGVSLLVRAFRVCCSPQAFYFGTARARVDALMALFTTRPYLVVEIVRQFSSAWKSTLSPLVKSCCEDIAQGKLSAGLLEATRERFKALLRGHTALFVLHLGKPRM